MSPIKFLLDECVESSLAHWLREKKFDVLYLNEVAARFNDTQILEIAHQENRVLVTSDKDFGDIVFLYKKPHNGVILLRFKYSTALKLKIYVFEKLLREYGAIIESSFIIVMETNIRIAKVYQIR
jgi:predicted nuclease of predicted toxin-antitoxin system